MKKIILASSIAMIMSGHVSQAYADEYADFEAYLGGARYLWENERNLDNSYSVEGGIEVPLSEQIALDAWFSSFDVEDADTGADSDGSKYSLGGLYHFNDVEDIRPFISLGASLQEFEPDEGDSSDETLAYIGLGAKKYFDNNLIARLEMMGMRSIDQDVSDMGVRLAVGYAFGRDASKPSPMPAPVSKPEPIDSDNDGVLDSADQCPSTAAGISVDSKGCPVVLDSDKDGIIDSKDQCPSTAANVAVDSKGCPIVLDDDNDGVPNTKDTCPDTANGLAVDGSGCMLDADSDGIADQLDLCPDTDGAFKVNAQGCPVTLAETISLDIDVKFKSNSDEISQGLDEVGDLAEFLNKFTDTSVTVEGYTDSTGPAAYNQKLSQKRADRVKNILVVDYGIDPARVTAYGYGEANPIASNDTLAGREANRRVVAKVSATIEEAVKK